jgi:hypothetical protein
MIGCHPPTTEMAMSSSASVPARKGPTSQERRAGFRVADWIALAFPKDILAENQENRDVEA